MSLNLMAGSGSLLIAGARSRIIIVAITLAIGVAVFLFSVARRRLSRRAARIGLAVALLSVVGFAVALSIGPMRERMTRLPVLTMLQQTLDRGDIGDRLGQSLDLSSLPEDVTLFGEGLGVTGSGRPGEFGIRAMWIESGLFWTPIMLVFHMLILISLARGAWRAASSGSAILTLLGVGAFLAWVFAVLAGLSSTFELSQALLLFPMIAVFSMMVTLRELTARRPAAGGRAP